MCFVLGAYGEIDEIIVLVCLELFHAVLGQSAETRLHETHFKNLFDLGVHSRKMLDGDEILLCLLQLCRTAVAAVDQPVDLCRGFG